MIRSFYEKNEPVWYIEDESELADLPSNLPMGTVVWCNSDDGFKVYMKNSNDEFNEL